MTACRILVGDVRDTLPTLADGSVRCIVTSPPYWGLRDYGCTGQLGLERTPEEYVANLVAVFREVRRVLADDGTLWLNLGDSYAGAPVGTFNGGGFKDASAASGGRDLSGVAQSGRMDKLAASGLKPKDLVGIPWRVAFALQADGWYLRSDIVWAKPNPMPESVTDRPTKAHEYVFLLSKAARYFYDAAAIAEPVIKGDAGSTFTEGKTGTNGNGRQQSAASRAERKQTSGKHAATDPQSAGRRIVESVATARANGADHDSPFGATRNARTVWTIATQPYAGAHFATFPEELARRCILAGSAPGDTVLDPFGGSGTVGAVAIGNGRGAILCELNPKYADLAVQRVGPMYASVA